MAGDNAAIPPGGCEKKGAGQGAAPRVLFLLSGEGPSDIGACDWPYAEVCCTGDGFRPGPMAALVDCAVRKHLGYSVLDVPGDVRFICKNHLVKLAKEKSKHVRVATGKEGKRRETFFTLQALALGKQALSWGEKDSTPVIAVLFHDTDGTRSASRTLWQDKLKSMRQGFASAGRGGYRLGVPMLPNPKSEAWLLCARKNNPYQGCKKLEEASGNDTAPNALKDQLEEVVGEWDNEGMTQWIRDGHLEIDRMGEMASFKAFRDDLQAALDHAERLPDGSDRQKGPLSGAEALRR
ncbi:MAG: hypothetical protein HQL66_13650 [Magnetococcales bacterium]|nr:hypothetical protein [Magnetococcales bacterium]